MFFHLFRFFVFIILCFMEVVSSEEQIPLKAVTYKLNGGRFGDRLLTYLHAKWVSYRYNLPFYYIPFEHSHELRLSQKETLLTKEIRNKFQQVILKDIKELKRPVQEPTLYVIRYFPESIEEQRRKSQYVYIPIDWGDPGFKKMIRSLVAPIQKLELLRPLKMTQNGATVALHVRKGGGYEVPNVTKLYPHKFPPENFYAAQLLLLSTLYGHQPLYVQIFTDDPSPEDIARRLEESLQLPNVTFSYRTEKNSHSTNVLEDFFSLLNYHCLIRPDSHFSIIAEKIGNFTYSISPASHYWEGDELVIDGITISQSKRL